MKKKGHFARDKFFIVQFIKLRPTEPFSIKNTSRYNTIMNIIIQLNQFKFEIPDLENKEANK